MRLHSYPTTKEFKEKDLPCEYAGNVVSHLDGLKLEEKYLKDNIVLLFVLLFVLFSIPRQKTLVS